MSAPQALPRGTDLRLIILDCDGVLFDSSDANVAFYDSILSAIGQPCLDRKGRELCHRLSGTQLWEELFGNDPALHRRAREVAAQADYSPFYPLMHPIPALEATLARLAGHCPLALATNRGRTVSGVLTTFGLEPFFAISLGVLDVPRPKPAPDLLLACLERAGVEASASVFVGDTTVDEMAAAAAGVPYVSVGGNAAVGTVRDIRELPDLLGIANEP